MFNAIAAAVKHEAHNAIAISVEKFLANIVRLPQSAMTESDAADAARFRWLCDAAGREWDALLGAQMTGQLRQAIDAAVASHQYVGEKP